MRRAHFLAIGILVLLVGSSLMAQTPNATVNGRVVDPSSLPIPDTLITLLNPSTGVTITTHTNANGYYSFPLVLPGSYRLTAEKQGFDKFIAVFQTAVDQTIRVDALLKVTKVSQTVTVTAQPSVVASDTSAVGQLVDTQQILDLPLNGENTYALAALSPAFWVGVDFGVGFQQTRSAAIMAGANNYTAEGDIPGYNEVLLDGVPITLCCQGQPALVPSAEVVQEFSLQTNTSEAEFGRTSGGIMNIVTKYGTNTVHGSAYEFFGNDHLNAANFFTNRAQTPVIPGTHDFVTPLRYNQFGFTFGGPIMIPKLYHGENKTFVFGGMEISDVRQYAFATGTTPTAAMREGDFSAAPGPVYDPATTVPNPSVPDQYVRTAFSNNMIPSNRWSSIASNYLSKYFPVPNASGVANNYSWMNRDPTDDHQGTIRVDHNISSSSRLFARWSIMGDTYTAGDWPGGLTWDDQNVDAETFVMAYTKTLIPSMLLNLRGGVAYQRNAVTPGPVMDGIASTSVGFPASFLAQQQQDTPPSIAMSGFTEIADQNVRNWSHPSLVLSPSVGWSHGAHNLAFGWDWREIRDNEYSYSNAQGLFSFDSTYTRGPNPLLAATGTQTSYDTAAAFLLGIPTSGSIEYVQTWARQQFYSGLFIKDDWHLTSKLTLNLGLRFDMETGFTERHNQDSWFNPALAQPLAQETGLPLEGGVAFSGLDGVPRQLWQPSHNFAPRVGLAYALTPKTALRAAYGIFFLPTTQRGYGSTVPGFQVSTNFVASINGVNPTGSLANPFPTGTVQLMGASQGALTLVGQSMAGMEYGTPTGYSQQWNFNIQRELPHQILISAAYVGNHGVKLPFDFNPDALPLQDYGTPGDTTQAAYLTALVPNPFYGYITTGTLAAAEVQRQDLLVEFPQFTSVTEQYLAQAYSTYNALELEAQKRYKNGLSLVANYTWSKNLGDAEDLTTGFFGVGTPAYQNNWDMKIEKSVLSTDIPQRIVGSAIYQLPFGKGRRIGSDMNPWLNGFVGGWEVSAITSAQSGLPLAFTDTGAATFAGSRPNFTGVLPLASSGPMTARLGGVSGGPGYLNPSAFDVPPAFQFGNVPRLTGNIRGPGNRQLDMTLLKDFPVHERVTMQFRAMAYNALNHPIFASPNVSDGAAAFGTIASQANQPRSIQFALKLLW